MYWNEIKKIASAAGFVVGLLTLAINLIKGHDLLHSSYMALIALFTSAIIFLFTFNGIGRILSQYLQEKKKEAEDRRRQEILEEMKHNEEMQEQQAVEHAQKVKEAQQAVRNAHTAP